MLETEELLQYLTPEGELTYDIGGLLDDKRVLDLYKIMVKIRVIDQKMLSYQRQGRIGFYAPCTGQEAAFVGAAAVLREQDWVFPAYRDLGAALVRGISVESIIDQLLGNSADLSKGRQIPSHFGSRSKNYVIGSSPIATEIPQAVGAAMAAKILGDDAVAMTFFGDGATSEGDFHVGLNFAGVFLAPCIFVCVNNQWAISMPVKRQTASKTIAVKAVAYGIKGVRVDGNDLLAVYAASKEALERALSGGGPTLIEAVTFRMGPHSTSDDPKKYGHDVQAEAWRDKDPIMRVKKMLVASGVWSEKDDEYLWQSLNEEMTNIFQEREKIPPPRPESLFEDVYSSRDWNLDEQLNELLEVIGRQDDSR